MLARWAPLDTIDREANELIRRAFGDFGTSLLGRGTGTTWTPAMDTFVRDEELHVRVEAPGLTADDFDIEVTDGVLRIRGERRHDQHHEQNGFVRREIAVGRFERAIALPDGTDADSLRATYEAGILEIAVPLPKKQASKVRVEVSK